MFNFSEFAKLGTGFYVERSNNAANLQFCGGGRVSGKF